MPRHVITGAPGTGKTALVTSLAGLGVTIGEAARELIAEHRAATGEPSLDHAPELFVDRLVERSIEKFDSVSDEGIVIYDRGLPDCVAYARVCGVSPNRALAAAATRRYADPVVVAPPWEDIYTTDEMRRATFDQVVAFHSSLLAAYEELGYELVELPKASIDARTRFVVDLLDGSTTPNSTVQLRFRRPSLPVVSRGLRSSGGPRSVVEQRLEHGGDLVADVSTDGAEAMD